MTVSSQLVVPMTLWGSQAPTHCISSVFMTKDQKIIVTGCNDGQICLWDVVDNMKIIPRSMLFGHTAPVLCLASGSASTDADLLVSSSEAGEMSLWDLTDGRCLENTKLPYVHTNIQSYVLTGLDTVRLFCNGYYAEILVMDVLTLSVVFTLASRVNPDWISAMHVLHPPKRTDDVVVALSTSGFVKVWTLNTGEMKPQETLYEDESKQIKCHNAVKLTCCAYNQRTVLIVCTKFWQIFDAVDFSLLCYTDNRRGERWMGGEFVSADRVLVWSDGGKGYLYLLPANSIAENKDFHSASKSSDQPFLYGILSISTKERLLCPPAMTYFLGTRGKFQKLMLRGDSGGRITIWNVPEVPLKDIDKLQQISDKVPEVEPSVSVSLQEAWDSMKPPPPGILDNMDSSETPALKLTSSVFLPLQGRLVCGREDGSIIIVSATQAVMLQLLYGKHHTHDDRLSHQTLHGHTGRVTCLLYPHHLNSRYDIAHLVSGGVDFSVCLWDIYTGTLLHRFCVHAGEITQLLVPPNNCSSRVLQCIASVASDHSVALLGLKEKKCFMLASRHLFPVHLIKWRPLDDFMIVACSDGSVYVWQMETGHLDRVVQGLLAEEILNACDENVVSPGDRMTNPAIHFFRGLRHRNLASIRHAAQRGLHHLQHHPQHVHTGGQQIAPTQHTGASDGTDGPQRARTHPLMIQGLRTNPKDQDSHVLFFDIEALIDDVMILKIRQKLEDSNSKHHRKLTKDIAELFYERKVQLLSEEYSTMSPGTLEAQGLINQSEYQKYLALSSSPETHRKLSGLIARVKDTAENAASKIQAKAESVGIKTGQMDSLSGGKMKSHQPLSKRPGEAKMSNSALTKPKQLNLAETNLTMEIAQLLLSLLHAWGLDHDLDKVCESKLGLLCPMRPVCFGLLSRGGHMALLLPTHMYRILPPTEQSLQSSAVKKIEVRRVTIPIPKEQIEEEERARKFSSRGHWELATAVTTNHLLSVISLANTLMSMNSATFVPEQEKRRKLQRKLSRADSKAALLQQNPESPQPGTDSNALAAIQEAITQQQAQIKQGWSLLAALHCVLLPDLVRTPEFKRPQVEMLARRWQDRCLEVREAAQALLLAELRRIGPKGRKAVVDEWACFLPNYGEPFAATHGGSHHYHHHHGGSNASTAAGSVVSTPGSTDPGSIGSAATSPSGGRTDGQMGKHDTHSSEDDEDEDHGLEGAEASTRHLSSATEAKRKQATAIVLLGVIGAEYGHEIEQSKRKNAEDQKKKSIVDGFGPVNYSLAWHTSQALAYLLLTPSSPTLPAHTSLRRAAIDLIGRGFTVWEAYLDVSKILLGLLELCCDSDKLVPSMSYGLPLTPAADSCRTARHALSLIATARPPAFITTLAKEVARYNTLAQNAQSLNISLHTTVLSRARPEILRIVELLIDKMQTEVADLLIEVMDIVLHCLDPTQLKSKGLQETFPAICRFNNVTYCGSTRRIAVGAKNGTLALYELRASKCQTLQAHSTTIVCCTFSPDGKYLATYASGENKLCFWQTAAGLFGLGNAQTRCVRTHVTPPLPESVKANPLKMARLVWVTNRMVILMLADGSENRFSLN